MGSTVIAYRDYSDAGSSTGKKSPAPPITKTERIVLVHLCRQYFSKSRRKAARSRDEIADAMFVGAPAVQAHLNNLYMKFDIDGERGTKRDLLAEKVIDMGVITPRDYPPVEDPTSS